MNAPPGRSVCRVVPDVPALDKRFDYLVPDELADAVEIGSIVRVRLHGRRVDAWVVETDVAPATSPDRLRPIDRVSSLGPLPEVVALTGWAAWRWCGPRPTFLRAASPPNRVRASGRDGDPGEGAVAVAGSAGVDDPSGRAAAELGAGAVAAAVAVVRWPPALDRRSLAAALVAGSGSTIVVAPGRLAPLVRALEERGRVVVELSGDQDGASRTRAWARARRGGIVVVGGRVAAWAPVPDLAAAVVLDEGDEALADERAPTWHARDVLVERARRAGCRLTLVSPTPTVEARALASPRRPPAGVERRGWPPLEVVDRRDEPPGTGLFSPALVDALHATRAAGGQAWCVLNRRGRARLLACRSCEAIARCEECGAAVVEGDAGTPPSLSCPRCGATRPAICADCGSGALRRLRPGVGRVVEEVDALVPSARVGLVEATTEVVPDADVLVGTEALLHRGTTRPRLVAFLEYDAELLAPRLRAAEQALWLLVRAARAVGLRGRGRLLVQTRTPGHEVIETARRGDPDLAAAAEERRRRALRLPPFGWLARLRGAPDVLQDAAESLRAAGLEVSGGEASVDQVLVRGPERDAFLDALGRVRAQTRGQGRLRIDVDPLRA